MRSFDQIKQLIDSKYPTNKGFFIFGSQNYKTNQNLSDTDIVVIDDLLKEPETFDDLDIQFMTEIEFKEGIKICDIKCLEGLFIENKSFKFSFSDTEIDWSNLRSSIAQKSSHSWSKAHKKIKVENDILIGQKSLFHSLRILKFGIQLAKNKKITDFTESNDLFFEIIKESSWEILKQNYKPVFNQFHSEFKSVCFKS